MLTVLKDGLFVIFATVAVVAIGLFPLIHAVDIRLRGGQAENQGYVEVRRNKNETWGKVCDLNFGEAEAAVVCSQLNYKYSRNDRGVLYPDFYDYRLENLNCIGNERRLGDCIKGEWKTSTGICNVKTNAYAGVCCSNSPDFGEMRDGLFVSHCADYWIDAEEKCEEKKGTLASLDEYKNILGSVHKDTQIGDGSKGYWIKSFFTPWMWSNGCFEFENGSFDHQEFNLKNNTVQACLQMCSIASPASSFLLSDNFCRCIPTESLKSYITEVLPGWCNRKCVGDSTYFCGASSRAYWSLYTIALERIFFKISDPDIYEYRQCAVLETSRKLSSEDCKRRNGYICGQILQENSSLPKLIFFQRSRFYEVLMLEARKKCTSYDTTMRLMGEQIFEQDIKFSQQYIQLWVDISRLLTDVYTINWEPENRKDTSLWRNMEPRWCLAARLRDVYFADEVTDCHTRFRYICSTNNKRGQTSHSNGSSAENDADTASLKTIIIAAVCGIVIVMALIVTVCVYRRSRKNRLRKFCCQKEPEYQEEHALENEYSSTSNPNNASPDHIYAEIKTENIYHEADTLLEHRDPNEKRDINESFTNTQDMDKDPVTMKRSYSSPKDLANLVEGSVKQNFKDPTYIDPYDKKIRSESETKPTDVVEPDALEVDNNEIIDSKNKHTVV